MATGVELLLDTALAERKWSMPLTAWVGKAGWGEGIRMRPTVAQIHVMHYVSRSVGTQESHLRRNRDGRDLVGDGWNGDVTEPRVNGFQVDPEILFLAGLVVAKP